MVYCDICEKSSIGRKRKMDVREIDKLKYAEEVFNIWEYSFPGDRTPQDLETRKKKMAEEQGTLYAASFEGESMAAVIVNYTYTIAVREAQFKMGGIGGVASLSEYRRGGRVREIMRFLLNYMYDNDFVMSALGPFSYEFYGKFGYAHAFDSWVATLPAASLKKVPYTGGEYYRAKPEDAADMLKVYNTFVANMNGPAIRSEQDMAKIFKTAREEMPHKYMYLYKNSDGQITGYIDFQIRDRLFKVREIFYTDADAFNALIHFIGLHGSSAEKIEINAKRDFPAFFLAKEPFHVEFGS